MEVVCVGEEQEDEVVGRLLDSELLIEHTLIHSLLDVLGDLLQVREENFEILQEDWLEDFLDCTELDFVFSNFPLHRQKLLHYEHQGLDLLARQLVLEVEDADEILEQSLEEPFVQNLHVITRHAHFLALRELPHFWNHFLMEELKELHHQIQYVFDVLLIREQMLLSVVYLLKEL